MNKKSEDKWKRLLTSEQYQILRKKETEILSTLNKGKVPRSKFKKGAVQPYNNTEAS